MLPPLNVQDWVAKNRHLLQPPVGNKALWDNGGFLVMVVGGPNARTDYHVNPAEELFFQVEGDIVVKVIENDVPRDVPIRAGEMFLLPPRVPHSPQRPAGSVGIVVETPKARDEDHHLQWYCRGCSALVRDFAFRPEDLGKQIKEMLIHFASDEALRTCPKCQAIYSV